MDVAFESLGIRFSPADSAVQSQQDTQELEPEVPAGASKTYGVHMTASKEKNEPRKLPMMPIRDMVIFPYMMTPFVVGRLSSVRALEEALNGDRKIFLATQHDASIDEPKARRFIRSARSATSCKASKCPTATSRCWSKASSVRSRPRSTTGRLLRRDRPHRQNRFRNDAGC